MLRRLPKASAGWLSGYNRKPSRRKSKEFYTNANIEAFVWYHRHPTLYILHSQTGFVYTESAYSFWLVCAVRSAHSIYVPHIVATQYMCYRAMMRGTQAEPINMWWYSAGAIVIAIKSNKVFRNIEFRRVSKILNCFIIPMRYVTQIQISPFDPQFS